MKNITTNRKKNNEELQNFLNMTKRNRRHEDKRAKGRKYQCRGKVTY